MKGAKAETIPVVPIPPRADVASISSAFMPILEAEIAAQQPAGPPPQTIMSYSFEMFSQNNPFIVKRPFYI